MRLTRLLMLVAGLVMVLPFSAAPAPALAATCEFVLGFKVIHDLIPDMVGDCMTNEFHVSNGDGVQVTRAWHGKGGLLVWRKLDNWTAYTDGANTWVNGPYGLQKRTNDTRFCPWEANPDNLPCVGNPPPTVEPPKTSPTPNGPGGTPTPKVDQGQPPVPMAQHEDAEKRFQYPKGWMAGRGCGGRCYGYVEPNGRALIMYYAPDRLGPDYKLPEYFIKWQHDNASLKGLSFGAQEQLTVNGFPAAIQAYSFTDTDGYQEKGLLFVIKNGALVYEVDYYALASRWAEFEPIFRWSISTFFPKSAG